MAGIRRVCSWACTVKTPKSPDTYSEILITFEQNQQTILNKTQEDVTISGDVIEINLTQEETALFEGNSCCFMQVRCYADEHDAPGSAIFKIPVQRALSEEILGGDEP